jgi:pimeloyl-ACP methyl ester carboxylesterase
MTTTGTHQLHDGRTLGYAEFGKPEGRALFYFHGHPGSRLEARFLAAEAEAAGVRLIGVDRPGMGLSTFKSGRRLLDWPDDLIELADHLHIDRFSVVGFSGGGPYALACAYRIPVRLESCGIAAGVGRINWFLAFLSQWMPYLILPMSARLFNTQEKAEETLTRFTKSWVEPDRKSLLQPGIKELMAASLVEALRQGAKGAAHDGALLGQSWGFRPEEIDFSPIYLWHGGLDNEVPIAQGRAVAEGLAHCIMMYYPEDGHISLIATHAHEIVSSLTGQGNAQS